MKQVAVVYWSGGGNTEKMAQAVCEGVKEAGAAAELIGAAAFSADKLGSFDAVAFGCPSMGAEELEESEFAPMFDACESNLNGRTIALFGSYGWGDGQWMREWDARCRAAGAVMACDFVICQEEPDEKALQACREMGKTLAG